MTLVNMRLTALLLCGFLFACAAPPPAEPPGSLLHDELFGAPADKVNAAEVFALSDDMRRYAAQELQVATQRHDPRRALVDALYSHHQLGLDYDATVTRNAAQAFTARSGNCLSLVIMTAAFAKHLGLPVTFRSVLVDDQYSRRGDLYLASGHVNLVLERLPKGSHFGQIDSQPLMVDFLPPEELNGRRTVHLTERRIVAMFMNNRAAEALSQQRLDDSYAWAREAVLQDPGFTAAVNTLGVVYMQAGHPREGEAALRAVLARDSDHLSALTNLASLLQREGRETEAQPLRERLASMQPHPPFHFFELGRQAMAQGDFKRASKLFARELRTQPDQHEVHFWAARADLALGDTTSAADHLRQAMENSPNRGSQDRYANKLDHLRASRLQ